MRQELLEPRLFVRFWFKEFKKFKMQPNGHFKGDSAATLSTMLLDYKELFSAEAALTGGKTSSIDAEGNIVTTKKRKYQKINDKDIEMAWGEFLILAKLEAAGKVLETIKYEATDDTELNNWLGAVVNNPTPLQVAVIKHVLWQVKRKAAGLEVVYHLTPCFFGAQGSGKSKAVKILIEPLSALSIEWGLNEAVDPRNTQTLADHYICLFDEMAGVQRLDVENLKRIISAEWSSYRPMHTNRQIKVRQNCTFIGISNKSIIENIYDTTGMRRFFEFECKNPINWAQVNSVNALSIWKSIDESLEKGYIEDFHSELKQHQTTLSVKDELQSFMDDTELMPIAGLAVTEISPKMLHRVYIAWRAQEGYEGKNALAPNWLCSKLKGRGLERKVLKVNRKEEITYVVNAESSIFGVVLIDGEKVTHLKNSKSHA